MDGIYQTIGFKEFLPYICEVDRLATHLAEKYISRRKADGGVDAALNKNKLVEQIRGYLLADSCTHPTMDSLLNEEYNAMCKGNRYREMCVLREEAIERVCIQVYFE